MNTEGRPEDNYAPLLKKPEQAQFLLRLINGILKDKIQIVSGLPERTRTLKWLKWEDLCYY